MAVIGSELLIQHAATHGNTEVVERVVNQCKETIFRTISSSQTDTVSVQAFAEFKSLMSKQTSNQGKAIRAAIREVNKNTASLSMEVKQLSSYAETLCSNMQTVQALSAVSTALSAANLCATASGFAIMNYKLDKISNDIKDMQVKVNQLAEKKNIDTIIGFEKLVSRYSELLDSERRLSDVPEKEYHDLTTEVFHYIKTLYTYFMQDVIDDKNAVLEALFSLSAILSHLLIKYDAVYYYAHKSVLAHGKRWHSDHEKWLGIFDRLCAKPFMDKLQDFFFLELGMSQRDSSEALSAVFFALTNERVKVLDNMVLIEQCDKAHDYYALMSAMNGEAIDQLKKQTLQLPEGYRSTVLPALEKKQKEFAIA